VEEEIQVHVLFFQSIKYIFNLPNMYNSLEKTVSLSGIGQINKGLSWSWSYGSWIDNYL